MAPNVAFNNISVILCWSVLLVEETTDQSQVTDILYHIMLYRVHISITQHVVFMQLKAHSGAPEFTPVSNRVRLTRSVVICVA
jgi:hypothetical protein